MNKIFLIFLIIFTLHIYRKVIVGNNKKPQGIYLRIVNIDTVATDGYIIGQHSFIGLKPGDTTPFKLIGRFNTSEMIAVIIDSMTYGESRTDCKVCDVDTPEYITLQLKVLYRNSQRPDLYYNW
jgi:hypothetical protein